MSEFKQGDVVVFKSGGPEASSNTSKQVSDRPENYLTACHTTTSKR